MYDTVDPVRVRAARSGRKHKIGNAHILAAMVNAGEPVLVGDQLLYLGLDDRGVELEIVAVPTTPAAQTSPLSTPCPPP